VDFEDNSKVVSLFVGISKNSVRTTDKISTIIEYANAKTDCNERNVRNQITKRNV